MNEFEKKGYSKAEVEILVKLTRLETELKNLTKKTETFVTKDEFAPIQRLVYGVVGVILVAVVGGIIALVVTP